MIGLFDSGFGGLTVLRAVVDRMPDRSFIYLGDHANAPYGGRPPDEIYDLTQHAVERLFACGCRLVVLACNTASAVALRRLQQGWLAQKHPERRVLGVLVPVVEAITRQPWQLEEVQSPSENPELVAIFATRTTVASGAFPREIAKRAPSVTVIQQACPRLAARIEAGDAEDRLRPLISYYAASLRDQVSGVLPDSVVLGCTHYPLVAHLFRAMLPQGSDILDQPALVARSLETYLARHPAFDNACRNPATPVFLTTGDPRRVSELGSRFYRAPITFDLERVPA